MFFIYLAWNQKINRFCQSNIKLITFYSILEKLNRNLFIKLKYTLKFELIHIIYQIYSLKTY